jgi:hypothetical protein
MVNEWEFWVGLEVDLDTDDGADSDLVAGEEVHELFREVRELLCRVRRGGGWERLTPGEKLLAVWGVMQQTVFEAQGVTAGTTPIPPPRGLSMIYSQKIFEFQTCRTWNESGKTYK